MMKSFWAICAVVVGLSSLGTYAYVTTTGSIIGSPEENFVPTEVSSRPGGYRAYRGWYIFHGGYRGGK